MKRAIYLSVLVVITVGCILWRVGSDAFGWFHSANDVGRILRTFKIKKNVEVTDNGKIII